MLMLLLCYESKFNDFRVMIPRLILPGAELSPTLLCLFKKHCILFYVNSRAHLDLKITWLLSWMFLYVWVPESGIQISNACDVAAGEC